MGVFTADESGLNDDELKLASKSNLRLTGLQVSICRERYLLLAPAFFIPDLDCPTAAY